MTESDSHLQDQEKRRDSRTPIGVSVLFPNLKKNLICRNISKAGCFFLSADLGPVGKIFPILIDPPAIGIIPLEVRIAHKGEDGKGTGLQFMDVYPEDAAKLSNFLDIFRI